MKKKGKERETKQKRKKFFPLFPLRCRLGNRETSTPQGLHIAVATYNCGIWSRSKAHPLWYAPCTHPHKHPPITPIIHYSPYIYIYLFIYLFICSFPSKEFTIFVTSNPSPPDEIPFIIISSGIVCIISLSYHLITPYCFSTSLLYRQRLGGRAEKLNGKRNGGSEGNGNEENWIKVRRREREREEEK